MTTTYRQHPVEGLLRYAYLAVFALALGASPAAFAFYRVWSVLMGQAEHANVRLPQWLDTAISWITMSPTMHKVHHSRWQEETDSNYSSLFSFWDRLFRTFRFRNDPHTIQFGLQEFDGEENHTLAGLLATPLKPSRRFTAQQSQTHPLAQTLKHRPSSSSETSQAL